LVRQKNLPHTKPKISSNHPLISYFKKSHVYERAILLYSEFMSKKHKNYSYKGYSIPQDLIDLTGGGVDTWDEIARYHMGSYDKYTPIKPDFTILEVGCGVGRDAIHLTKKLSDNGTYIGVDIIKPSIDWCTKNITSKYPNFTFDYLDIYSQIHNPSGKLKVTDVTLPGEDGSVDLIILQSVFTHMFSWDIVHYLAEFRRLLKPGGKVFASFFVLDPEALQLVEKTKPALSFKHKLEEGCYLNDKDYPEGAIGYTPEKLHEMLQIGGMRLDRPVYKGFWCGRVGDFDGQDIAILSSPVPPPLSQRLAPRRLLGKLKIALEEPFEVA